MVRGRPLLKSLVQLKMEDHVASLAPRDAGYIRDWASLTEGEQVCVAQENGSEFYGRVDAVTEDGSVLWVHLAGGAGRRLFARSEGDFLWRVSRDVDSSQLPVVEGRPPVPSSGS
jgi:hypothetical protein